MSKILGVLNDILRVLRSRMHWRDLSRRYGPRVTCNHIVRWRKGRCVATPIALADKARMPTTPGMRIQDQCAPTNFAVKSRSRRAPGFSKRLPADGRRRRSAAVPMVDAHAPHHTIWRQLISTLPLASLIAEPRQEPGFFMSRRAGQNVSSALAPMSGRV